MRDTHDNLEVESVGLDGLVVQVPGGHEDADAGAVGAGADLVRQSPVQHHDRKPL